MAKIKEITGKRVIFVGPSPCIQGKGLGEWIDSFDTVVRTNGSVFLIEDKDFVKDYGSKCSMLFFNIQFQRSTKNINIKRLKNGGLKSIYCKAFISPLYEFIASKDVPVKALIPSEDVKKVEGLFMGTLILDFITSCNPKEFHITGMDFYNSEDRYIPGYLPPSSPETVNKESKSIHNPYSNNLYIYNLISSGKISASPEIIRDLHKALERTKT